MGNVRDNLDAVIENGLEFAQRYSIPLLVFRAGEKERELATGSFVKTSDSVFLVTAKHVVEEFLRLGPGGRMQIGTQAFVLSDLDPKRVRCPQNLDVAIIEFDDATISMNGWPILNLVDISIKPVKQLDLVAYCGFPGDLKDLSGHQKTIRSFSLCATIDVVELDQFSMRVDEERFETDIAHVTPMFRLGGVSGAPVFSIVDINDGRIRKPLLVGWVHEGAAWSRYEQKHYAVPTYEVLYWFRRN
ncbi:hypothetical protein FALB51S_01978 [Frigidibacter albus]